MNVKPSLRAIAHATLLTCSLSLISAAQAAPAGAADPAPSAGDLAPSAVVPPHGGWSDGPFQIAPNCPGCRRLSPGPVFDARPLLVAPGACSKSTCTRFQHVGETLASIARADTINPQPLPPEHGGLRVAVNPQPLPPEHGGSTRLG